MRLAAHPPSYLPFSAFFYKMFSSDILVLADDFQYTTHGLINRTKIKTSNGPNWLTVPVLTKGYSGQLIRQVRIDVSQNWGKRHWRTLKVNYAYAPYFEKYAPFFETLYSREWTHLLDLNLQFIEYVRAEFDIARKFVLSSDLSLSGTGSRRLMEMLEKLGCDTYCTEVEFQQYLSVDEFRSRGFEVEFLAFSGPEYHQLFDSFTPGLSFVDLLFNEGDEALKIIREA